MLIAQHSFYKLLIFVLVYLSGFSCLTAQPSYTYQVPVEKGDGWPTTHLVEKGIDTTFLLSFFRNMTSEKEHGLHSILLLKDEHLVLEEYYGRCDASKTHDMRSATESITALLVGIALDKGFIQSIDDPVFKYLTHYQPVNNPDESKEQITLRHLLTMSTGLACNDWDKKSEGQEDKMYKKNVILPAQAELASD